MSVSKRKIEARITTPCEVALVKIGGTGQFRYQIVPCDKTPPAQVVALGEEGELQRLGAVLGAADAEAEQAETLLDALSPEHVLGPAATEQLRLNAQARIDFLHAWPSLTSAQVADHLGSTAGNRAAFAHKLVRRGQIFSVRYKGRELYPLFQLDRVELRPLPVVAEVLRSLTAAGLRGWEIAFWFVEPNGWLEQDARPVDLLVSDPEAIVAAAGHEADVPE